MKLPKIKIQTQFWNETNSNEWIKRFEKYIYVLLFACVVNIAIARNTGTIIWNGIYILIGMLMIISKNKWSKNK